MTINLFPDQSELMDKARESMRRHKRVLIQASTGFGKTVLGSSMIAGSREKGHTSIFIVPRRELLKQTAKTFDEYNMPFSYVSAGYPMNRYSRTFLATTGTLCRRLDKISVPKVVFIDEAHYAGETNKRIADYFAKQGAWIIGLTATPEYPNGDGMGDCYSDMVCGPSTRWLMDNKRLSEYRLFAPSRPNLEGVKIVADDYAKGQLADRMEADGRLIGNAVKHYKDHAMGRLNIAYCTSRKHSEMVAESFRLAGVPAAHVDGDTPDDEMRRIIRAFANREIKVLTNADLLLFGFDLSAASGENVTVESMSDLRPTKSTTLQRQKWGRVLRYKTYPALIFDHGGNTIMQNGEPNHGFPDDDIPWILDAKNHTDAGGSRADPVKQCNGGFIDESRTGEKIKGCFFAHRPAPRCPNCGAWYAVDSRMVEEVGGDLQEISRPALPPPTPEEAQRISDDITRLTKHAIDSGVPRARAAQWARGKIMQQRMKAHANG